MTKGAADLPRMLTVKEVADLLRVRERKVYDMAAAGEIPHRRLTAKLLFPADEISTWMDVGDRPASAIRPDVLVGSHDPLLEWSIRESGSGLAALVDGSADGLARFATGAAAMCGLHVPEADGWNLETVQSAGIGNAVLIHWARRHQGLILRNGLSTAEGVAVLKGKRVALRQPGAGGRALFDRLVLEAGLPEHAFEVAESVARTETDIAASIASGEADVAMGLESMARQFGLGFLPHVYERFDLLVDRRAWFTEPLQTLFRFASTEAFARKAEALGGYDISQLGAVRWISP